MLEITQSVSHRDKIQSQAIWLVQSLIFLNHYITLLLIGSINWHYNFCEFGGHTSVSLNSLPVLNPMNIKCLGSQSKLKNHTLGWSVNLFLVKTDLNRSFFLIFICTNTLQRATHSHLFLCKIYIKHNTLYLWNKTIF